MKCSIRKKKTKQLQEQHKIKDTNSALPASPNGLLPLKKITPLWIEDSAVKHSLAADANLAFVSFRKGIQILRH
jgi:hypothetical protein